MTRTQHEDSILIHLHSDFQEVTGPRDYLDRIKERDGHKPQPDDGLDEMEFNQLWDGLVEMHLIQRAELGNPERNYWFLTELGRERIAAPGTEARMLRDAELKAVYESPHKTKVLVRNQVLNHISESLIEVAKATGYAGVRVKEPLYEIAHALNRIADAMDDGNARLHCKGAAQRSGQRKSHAQGVREIEEKASAIDRHIRERTEPKFELANPGTPPKRGKK